MSEAPTPILIDRRHSDRRADAIAAGLIWLERRLLALVAGPLRAEPRGALRPAAGRWPT